MHQVNLSICNSVFSSLSHQTLRNRNILNCLRIPEVNQRQLHLGTGIALTCRLEKPLGCLSVISGNAAVAILINQAQVMLHLGIAVGRRALIPLQGNNIIGLHANTK